MNSAGCFACGSATHHRRDCNGSVSPTSVRRTKLDVVRDQRADEHGRGRMRKCTEKLQILETETCRQCNLV